MGHGKKKWIIAYDGKLKRSNDRTKKDYYRDLKNWEPMDNGRRYGRQKGEFCPQCKHVQKQIVDEREKYWEQVRQLHNRYDEQYGAAYRQWSEYKSYCWKWKNAMDTDMNVVSYPTLPEPPSFYDWKRTQPDRELYLWQYDTRSYLCYKCERKYEIQWSHEFWEVVYPRKHTWTRRQDYRDYRNDVKNMLNRAKYDDDLYEDIPNYKRGWLD
jgi:hypothetical protein